MYRKCYPLADAFMVPNQYPQSRKAPKWRILAQVSENVYILCSTSEGYVRYAPMYIHSFRLIAPRRLLEAQLFNQQYQNYEDIPNVPDRLRWCRHHMGLMQKEVADLIGITRGHYIDFEVGYVDHYPKTIEGQRELAERVAGVHASLVNQHIKKLNCPSDQKVQLLDAVIKSASTKKAGEQTL